MVKDDGKRANELLSALKQDDINALMKKLTNSVVNRFKQELQAENEEFLDRELLKYRAKVARRTWHVAQKWCKWTNEGPVLCPDNTRLYYRKGQTEVMVLEYPPQVRLMKFVGSLAKRSNSSELIDDGSKGKVFNYSLALPYMVFLFRFEHGVFRDVYVSFCDRPLKRLEEKPLRPFLSNIDNTLKLCLGVHMDLNQLEKGNLVQQVALVLSHFWHTVYNEDWSGHFWEYRRHFAGNSQLKDLDAWQEASLDNPSS